MDAHTLSLLDFDRIKDIVSVKTQTPFGKELAQQIKPMTKIAEIEYEFDLTQECLNVSDEISLSNIIDLRPYLTIISDDTVLSPLVLRDTLTTLQIIRKTKEFFTKRKENHPKLFDLIKKLPTHELIENAIDKAVDEFGEIKSDATPRLKKIRSELTQKRNEIIKKLERIIIESSAVLQDRNFTIRHNRFCIPIKAEAQKKIPGILHEFSPAGKTIFLEPLSLVDDQNEFAKLGDEENSEIHRILSNLSKEIFKIRDELIDAFSIIGKIDLLFAKKRFVIQFNCNRPAFSKNGKITIIYGIHPLLKISKSEIVPLNFIFPDNTNIILISGPNAGGKTVVMKTVGLFVLMFLSGIYLPAASGTEIPFFEKVFADIGDEQSLDSNLSSFSAHIIRLKDILENADNKSLVLLDELGSSTAPEEGSAIAMAVLETLRDKGAYCLVTSHFNPLKAFVNDAPGMVNSAMEFTDRPTYRFAIGFPGTSSAFEISKDLGLPDGLLQRAKNFLNQDWLKLSERLKLLASETEKIQELNKSLLQEKASLEQLRVDYENKLKKFKAFENEERKKVLSEGRRFLLDQRRNIENIIRRIKETNAEKKAIIEAKKYIEEKIDAIVSKDVQEKIILSNDTKKKTFNIGDQVLSKTFQKPGIVVETSKDNITVAFGSIRFELNADDLEKVTNDSEPAANKLDISNFQSEYFEPILSIRGQTKEEALTSINKFLDEAINNNITEVSIIHGKGKGVLKDLIWDTLNHDTRVTQLRFGESFEGGMGMTKIILKKKE